MAIFQWGHRWGTFHDLERQVDRLLVSMRLPLPTIRINRHYPAVNMYELEDEFLLTAELPGTSPDNLELTVSGGILTLKGTRPGPESVPDEMFRRHERVWGNWQRSLSIQERIDEEHVSAEFNDGVLRVHLPKAKELQARQIPVTSTNGD